MPIDLRRIKQDALEGGDDDAARMYFHELRRRDSDDYNGLVQELREQGRWEPIKQHAQELYEGSLREGGSELSARAAELFLRLRAPAKGTVHKPSIDPPLRAWFPAWVKARYAVATREDIRFFAPGLPYSSGMNLSDSFCNGFVQGYEAESRKQAAYGCIRSAWPYGLRASDIAVLLGCTRKQADRAARAWIPSPPGSLPPWEHWRVLPMHWKDEERNADRIAWALHDRFVFNGHDRGSWTGVTNVSGPEADAWVSHIKRLEKSLRQSFFVTVASKFRGLIQGRYRTQRFGPAFDVKALMQQLDAHSIFRHAVQALRHKETGCTGEPQVWTKSF